jgi:predicted nucleic acid-binding protein
LIVLDASVVVDLLLNTAGQAQAIVRIVIEHERHLCAPHLLDAEVGQVLRRFVRAGAITHARAEQALTDLSDLSLVRYGHLPLLPLAFSFSPNVTFYDALYLALAQVTGGTLVTRDQALARVPRCTAKVRVLN